MSLTESLEVASIVCARNGGQMTDLHRWIDPYSAFRAIKEKVAEIGRLKTALSQANKERPKGNTGGGGGAARGSGHGYFGGGQGRGAHVQSGAGETRDPAYSAMKRTLCKFYNEQRGCDRQESCQRLHKCSVRTGEGQACMADHPYYQHRTAH